MTYCTQGKLLKPIFECFNEMWQLWSGVLTFFLKKSNGDFSLSITFDNLWQTEEDLWETGAEFLWIWPFHTIGNLWTLGKLFSVQEGWKEKMQLFFDMERESGSHSFLPQWIALTFCIRWHRSNYCKWKWKRADQYYLDVKGLMWCSRCPYDFLLQ